MYCLSRRLVSGVSTRVKRNLCVRGYSARITHSELVKNPPKLCKDCVWFKPDDDHFPQDTSRGLKFGSCQYFGNIDLVSGVVTYEFASVARETICKGELWTKKESSEKPEAPEAPEAL